jgi:hypothetical protein
MLKSMGQSIKKEHTISQKKDGNSRLFESQAGLGCQAMSQPTPDYSE